MHKQITDSRQKKLQKIRKKLCHSCSTVEWGYATVKLNIFATFILKMHTYIDVNIKVTRHVNQD